MKEMFALVFVACFSTSLYAQAGPQQSNSGLRPLTQKGNKNVLTPQISSPKLVMAIKVAATEFLPAKKRKKANHLLIKLRKRNHQKIKILNQKKKKKKKRKKQKAKLFF